MPKSSYVYPIGFKGITDLISLCALWLCSCVCSLSLNESCNIDKGNIWQILHKCLDSDPFPLNSKFYVCFSDVLMPDRKFASAIITYFWLMCKRSTTFGPLFFLFICCVYIRNHLWPPIKWLMMMVLDSAGDREMPTGWIWTWILACLWYGHCNKFCHSIHWILIITACMSMFDKYYY